VEGFEPHHSSQSTIGQKVMAFQGIEGEKDGMNLNVLT